MEHSETDQFHKRVGLSTCNKTTGVLKESHEDWFCFLSFSDELMIGPDQLLIA